jgi:hypothetical protein
MALKDSGPNILRVVFGLMVRCFLPEWRPEAWAGIEIF